MTLESVPLGSGLILKYLGSGLIKLLVPGGLIKTSAHGTALIETDTREVAGGTTRGSAILVLGGDEAASSLGGRVSSADCPLVLIETKTITQ